MLMIYLLGALVILTFVALFIAPRLGLLLVVTTAALLAYEFTAARYVLLVVVASNVLLVLVLLGAELISRSRRTRAVDAIETPPLESPSTTEQRPPPADS